MRVLSAKSRRSVDTSDRDTLHCGSEEPSSKVVYSHSDLSRNYAKIAALAVLCIMVMRGCQVIGNTLPLPSTLYGRLRDERTGAPREGLQVRVLGQHDLDLTSNVGESDSVGFFIITTKVRSNRGNRIRVYDPNCRVATYPMSHPKRQTGDDIGLKGKILYPFFEVEVRCGRN